jgi:hypothetical protein
MRLFLCSSLSKMNTILTGVSNQFIALLFLYTNLILWFIVPYVCSIISMFVCTIFWVRDFKNIFVEDYFNTLLSITKLSSKIHQENPTMSLSETKAMLQWSKSYTVAIDLFLQRKMLNLHTEM